MRETKLRPDSRREIENNCMALEVKLQAYEGPLDLLLHLIDVNKVDIYDIPIAGITDQYLEYIRAMEKENMDVTSEFLVMAATLLDIKCRMLLPKEVNEEGEELDPRQELVEKLLEYKMYKYMSFELRERSGAAAREMYRERRLPDEVAGYMPPIDYDELIGDTTLSALNDLFLEILRRQKYRVDPVRSSFGTIERDAINLSAKQTYIRAYLTNHRHTSFRQLLEEAGSRQEVIVTFLVVLELMKNGSVEVTQEENFGEIMIDTKEETLSGVGLEENLSEYE